MDCSRVGNLILHLRKEKGMTQKQLAESMNISDKAISKWERGLGCPDISLISELSTVLGVNIEKILSGSLESNDANGGNMNKVKFYVCPDCGSTTTSAGETEISCCGRKLTPLVPRHADNEHETAVTEIENDFYITFTHSMSKAHYLSFAAYVTYDKMLFIKLYPEQGSEVRFPKMHGGKLYFYCNQHGLWMTECKL